MSAARPSIVWFRHDLRLRDNPALYAAIRAGGPVIPVFIWSPREEGAWAPGAASRWWLHCSLEELAADLRTLGSRLILARGAAATVLARLAATTGASTVLWNKRYEPAALRTSEEVKQQLRVNAVTSREFDGTLLTDPLAFRNRSGKPYQVFTAFQRGLLQQLDPGVSLPAPRQLRPPASWPATLSLRSLGLLPRLQWYKQFATHWQPGERGAQQALRRFQRCALRDYAQLRDVPGVHGTSRLSPHLHWGEISPRRIWHALGAQGRSSAFFRQIIWREFAYHLLVHFPQTPQLPLRREFAAFPWRRDARQLRRWQRGRTGVALVDAGMRELWATGWMHNRVRLVVGSYLVKNLLIPWQDGARWFWDTLLDADLANNTLNWQWVAGCGADAAPYFRIFNPCTQAKRFDRDARYRRQWVPEADNPDEYPAPMVDLADSRERALQAFRRMRQESRRARR